MREKDTAVILLCCILMVLIAIFFFSERRKFLLKSSETTAEGCEDQFNLEVRSFRVTGRGSADQREILAMTRTIRLTRTILYMGTDGRGMAVVDVAAPPANGLPGFTKRTTSDIDLTTNFLPEGSCNFNFFDADLINYRGDVVRKGEKWKFMRSLSIYGDKERSAEIQYAFIAKENREGGPDLGVVRFTVPDKTWLNNGLHAVEMLEGHYWISEADGRVERAECSFFRENEQECLMYRIDLKRDASRMLAPSVLARLRLECENPGKVIVRHEPSEGTGKEIPQLFAPAPGPAPQPVPAEKDCTVQVASFTDRNQAVNLARQLKTKGYDAFVLRQNSSFNACVGRYPRRSERIQTIHEIMTRYFPDAFVREIPAAP